MIQRYTVNTSPLLPTTDACIAPHLTVHVKPSSSHSLPPPACRLAICHHCHTIVDSEIKRDAFLIVLDCVLLRLPPPPYGYGIKTTCKA